MSATWDAANKGPDVVLSGGSLIANIGAHQQAVRCTLGRDPAAGGKYQWEITVPGGSVFDDVRPCFGMANAAADMTVNSALFFTLQAWAFSCGVHTFTQDSIFHNGDLAIDWSGASGSGGLPFVAGLVYDATAKTLAIYKNGVLKYTLASVGTNGTTIYPTFASGSNAGSGSMSDHGTANFGSTAFAYAVGGATAWAPLVPPVPGISASPTSGAAPVVVTFTNTTTGGVSYAWNFGDGDASTATNPVHAYRDAGTYTVTLTATNGDGSASTTTTITVAAPDASPTSDQRHPRIGYRCIGHDNETAVVTSDSTATDYLPENIFDWLPYTYWKPAATGEHYVQLVIDEAEPADYVAIGQHNLGENGGRFKLQYSQDSGGTWADAIDWYTPSGREQVWLDFDELSAAYWRLVVDAPVASVVGVVSFGLKYRPYYGQISGFQPPGMARSFDLYASTSETGLFLGRSILRKRIKGSLAFDLMGIPDAYGDWVPFMQAAEQHPFFLAWMLDDWPEDVQLVQTAGDWTPPAMTQFGFIGTRVSYVGLLQE